MFHASTNVERRVYRTGDKSVRLAVFMMASSEGFLPPGRARQRNGWPGAGSWRSNSFPTAQSEAPSKV